MQPRFILIYRDDNDEDRNTRRVADGFDEAIQALHDFLDDAKVWDEDLHDGLVAGETEPSYEDALRPALEYLLEVEAEKDVAALVAAMHVGRSINVQLEEGEFEICRER